jgi:hypothetical protein
VGASLRCLPQLLRRRPPARLIAPCSA